jgi:methionyl-tRNA formyltransferase
MGTPAFACPILSALLGRSDPVVGVVCQPDRPRGRGLGVTAPEVKQLALRHGVPVLQPERLRDPGFQAELRALAPDVIVVAAYGKILPRSVLDVPPAAASTSMRRSCRAIVVPRRSPGRSWSATGSPE